MKVRTKLESIKIIKEKKLNSFPEKLFYRNQKECKESIRMVENILAKVLAFIPDKIELKKINKSNDEFQIDNDFLDLIEKNKNVSLEKGLEQLNIKTKFILYQME